MHAEAAPTTCEVSLDRGRLARVLLLVACWGALGGGLYIAFLVWPVRSFFGLQVVLHRAFLCGGDGQPLHEGEQGGS